MPPTFQTHWRTDAAASQAGAVLRRDTGYLRSPSKTVRNELLAEGVAAIAGIYEYAYRDSSGDVQIVRELVDADVLEDFAAQLARAPLTVGHPAVPVDRHNVKDLAVGDIGEEVDFVKTSEGGFIRVRVCVRADEGLQAIEDGIDELSCGYSAEVDTRGGTHPVFGPYDQKQTRRTLGNHLALVDRARHGSSAKLRADAASLAELPEGLGIQLTPPRRLDSEPGTPPGAKPADDPTTPSRKTRMDLLLLAMALRVPKADGMSADDLQAAVVQHIHALQAKVDSLDAAIEAARADASSTHQAAAEDAHKALSASLEAARADGFSDDLSLTDLAQLAGKHIEALQARADTAQAAAETAQKVLDQQKADGRRAELDALVAARSLKLDGIESTDGKTDSSVAIADYEKAIAKAMLGDRLKADASETYITVAVDHALESLPKGAQGRGSRGDSRDRFDNDDRYTSPTDPKGRGNGSGDNNGGNGKGGARTDSRTDRFFTPDDDRNYRSEA